jgi:hypothetical protein
MDGKLQSILSDKGIEHRKTMPYTPQQNGLAEQWNRIILDKARAMIHSVGLSLGFWELAVDAAVHTYNRSPTRVLKWRTPHEIWNDGHVPDVSYFRIFGCLAYAHVPEELRKKLDPRSIPTIFVGYEPESKGYRLWNRSKRSVMLSRDVTFDERVFPAKESVEPSAPPVQPLAIDWPVTVNFPSSEPGGAPPAPPPQTPGNTTVYATPPSRPPPSLLTPIDAPPLPGLPLRRPPPHPPEPGPVAAPPNRPPSPRRLRANPKPTQRYLT